jgi:hypothetical protein
VPPVPIVALIGIQPPCYTEAMRRRQRTENAELQIVADVADVAVLQCNLHLPSDGRSDRRSRSSPGSTSRRTPTWRTAVCAATAGRTSTEPTWAAARAAAKCTWGCAARVASEPARRTTTRMPTAKSSGRA